MIVYSTEHELYYDRMATEMIRFAGYQDSVNDRLRLVSAAGGCKTEAQSRAVDDLYRRYGQQDVLHESD